MPNIRSQTAHVSYDDHFTLCALAQRGTPLLQNPSSGTPRRQLKPAAWRPAVSALGVAVLLGCQASWAAPDALIGGRRLQ